MHQNFKKYIQTINRGARCWTDNNPLIINYRKYANIVITWKQECIDPVI